ncbi:MAG: DNA topoisomerase VI subunit B [Candidatus Heimdallarchaeaceae archaeon]
MSDDKRAKKMSAAAFFNDNKAIAGFGNSMRAVFTSIRELVENGLDAAEIRGVNPIISIDLRRLSSREINDLLDVTQYKKLEKHLDFLQLTCRDNGVGVPSNQIADLFGRVLTGTKYGVIQTRGRFGLGAKMCLLHSMSSVDLPARIKSRYFMDDMTHELHLMIDLERNQPIVMEQREYLSGDPNALVEPGVEISITFTGAWRLAKNSVKEYFRQLAIITPYASFDIKVPGDKDGEYEELHYVNVVDDMPPPPQHIKIHPWGCDITQFKAELSSTKAKKMKVFLAEHFMGVTKEIAEDFFQLLEIDPNKSPSNITSKEIRRIVHEGFIKAYQEAKDVKRKRDRIFQFDPPRGDALSPLGAGRLRKGLEKELQPKFVEAVTRPPKAYSGHPFAIEATMGYGGGVNEASQAKGATVHDNKIIYRYANRIPLIFGAGNDVITQVVSSIRWNDYGLTRQSDPLAIAVSLVSTKIPFPETSKEYISSVPEIEEEIRLALMQLGRRLKTFLSRAKRRKREHARLSRFVKSAPVIIENLTQILEDENLKFTDFRLETDRISASLAHGTPKKVRLYMPIGTRLFGANIWCPNSIQITLKNNDIESVSEFLLKDSKELATLLQMTEAQIYDIKLRTIYELDRDNLSPSFDTKTLVSRLVERRFSSEGDRKFISLKDALFRRWIQNVYHYLATDFDKLRAVSGMLEKFFETKKDELLNDYLAQGAKTSKNTILTIDKAIASFKTVSDLKKEQLYPPFKYLKTETDNVLGEDLSIEEFLYQTVQPTSINYHPEITRTLIEYLKIVFTQITNKFPAFATSSITRMKPDWTDGYTKNAFHRRKIKTVNDFLNHSTDDLIDIKELERIMYEQYIELITTKSKSVPLKDFSFVKIQQLEADENLVKKDLAKHGIKTLAQFLSYSSEKIFLKKLDTLGTLLLKESKFKLSANLHDTNRIINQSYIKIIPHNVEAEFARNQIFTTSSFLAKSSVKLKKMGMKKKDIERAKKELGTPLQNWVDHAEILKKCGIIVLEELFFNDASEYNLTPDEKKKYNENIIFLRSPLVFALPELRSSSYLLTEIGINNIGRFLIWSNSELSDILYLSVKEIEALKKKITYQKQIQSRDRLGKVLTLFSRLYPNLVKYFGDEEPSIQDLYYAYQSENFSLNIGFWKNLSKLSELSQQEAIDLVHLYPKNFKDIDTLKEALLRLKSRNVETIRQFMELQPEIIGSKLSDSKERKVALDLYDKILTRRFEGEQELHKQILLLSEYDEFQRNFGSPISRIPELALDELEKFRSHDIIAVHQIFDYTVDEITTVLGREKESVQQLIENFTLLQKGTPFYEKTDRNRYKSLVSYEFEDLERFSSIEIQSLIQAGYASVDQLFYLTHPLTFSSSILNWNVVDKFRKLLRSPLTLVTWEKTVKTKTFDETENKEVEVESVQISTLTTSQLNILQKQGISRIIDLLVSKSETLAEALDISVKDAQMLQKDIRISDTGTDLAELDIFKSEIVDQLEEDNILTLEDLYFSTSKSKWRVKAVPWDIIESFKSILNLPLAHLSDMLDEDILAALEDANVKTLLGFMLTTPESLMNKTGIPDERFETIKRGMDISDIFSYFSLPSYFLPNLTFQQTEFLKENDLKSVAEFINSSPQKINKLIKITAKQFRAITADLTTQSLHALYDEKGIFAFETKLFDKMEQRLLGRDSIFEFDRFQTIQEIYYTLNRDFYLNNQDLWEKVSAIQKVLALPLHIFTEISEYALEIMSQNGIDYVYQLLFIHDADITDPLLFRTVSTYSSKIIEMRAFHYFSKLPASVYNSNYFKRILKDTSNKSLSDVITDEKVINDLAAKDTQYLYENYNLTIIRSILELPLRITPYFTRIKKIRREEYKNTKIGDVFDIDLEEHSALSSFYSRLYEENSFNKLISQLTIPISSMGLPRELALKLSKSSIGTLIDFYSTPEKQVSEISGFSQKNIREIKDGLTYSSIVSFRVSQAHKIKPSSLVSEKQIFDLMGKSISDIESLFYSAEHLGISRFLPLENYKKIKEILSGSIRFVGFLSFDEIRRLEYHNINSIIDFALLSKKDLFTITQNPIYKEFHVLDLISFDELSEKRIQAAIPLSLCPSIEEDYLEKIKEIGINSIQDFISRMTEIRESHPHLVKLDIFREVQMYLSSVAYIGLPNESVQKLTYSGVGDILSFITEDPSTISLILGISEKQVEKYVKLAVPSNLVMEVDNKGVLLTEFSGLSKGRRNSLLKSGKETVQDLFSSHYQAYSQSNISDGLMSEFIESCNMSLYRIVEIEPGIKAKLSKSGITRIIDLFCSTDIELKKALDGKLSKEFKLIRKGHFTLTKGIPLSLNEPLQDIIRDLNIETSNKKIEDMFGFIPEFLLQFTESERIEKDRNLAFLEQIVSFLSLNILSLPSFDTPTKLILWNRGIRHVIELLSTNMSTIDGIPFQVISEVRSFQKDFNLSRSMSETFSPYIDDVLNLPAKKQVKLQNYGLTSALLLVDFIPHPIFSFTANEQSILRIVSNNMFKPITWLSSDVSFKIEDINLLIQNRAINILSALLLLSDQDDTQALESLSNKYYKSISAFLNSSILQLSAPEWALQLSDTKIITDTNSLKLLKKENISYLDEFLTLESKFLNNPNLITDVLPKLLSLKSLPISSISDLSPSNIQKLKRSRINNVYEFLVVPAPLLSNLLTISVENVNATKSSIDLSSLEKTAKLTGLDLELFPELSKDSRIILQRRGCVSLNQASKMDLDLIPLLSEDKALLQNLIAMLFTPITLIGKILKLTKSEIDELLIQNICTYADLLELPQKTWPAKIRKSLSDKDSDPTYLIKNLQNLEKFGVPVEKLDLAKSVTNALVNAGIVTIDHLYYLPIIYVSARSKVKQPILENIKEKLSYNINFLQDISHSTLSACYSKESFTIISCLIYWNALSKEVRKDLEGSIDSIKLIEETEFIEPLTPTETKLKSIGVLSLRSFILSPQIKKEKGLTNKLLPSLLANIRFLNLDSKRSLRLKKAGFTTIADLLLNTSKTMSVKSKLGKNAIDEIINNIKIDNLTSSIKSMEQEHLHDAFYLNTNDKTFLKSIGVYSLADLNEYTVFDWFVSNQKIRKIKKKINSLLDTNILYYPGITSKQYAEVVEQYFMKDIFTIKDLMISTTVKQTSDLIEFLTIFSTNKPKIQSRYVTSLSFLKGIETKDLFKNDVKIEKSATINDLIVALYKNSAELTKKGDTVLKQISYPISISSKLNLNEVNILLSKNILSYGDVLIKPAGYWVTFTPVKLKKKLLEILSTITSKIIANDSSKGVQLSSMRIFDTNLKKQLTSNFKTLNEVAHAIRIDDPRILKPIERKINKVLSTPISLLKLPKISIKSWKRLLSTASTLEEFYLLTDQELVKILSYSKEEIVKLKNNLSPENIILPPRIKENKIFTSSDVKELSDSGISNYIQIFDESAEKAKLSTFLKDKITFYKEFDVKQLDENIEETILLKDFVLLDSYADSLALSRKQKESVKNLSSLLLSRGTPLSKIFDLDPNKDKSNLLSTTIAYFLLIEKYKPKIYTKIIESLQEKFSSQLNALLSYLNRSPILLSGPNLRNINKIVKLPYENIKDLLLLSKEKLIREIDDTAVQRNVRGLTLSVLKGLDSKLTYIPKEFLTAYEINQLKKENIYSFEEALVFNRKSTSKKSKPWLLSEKVRKISTINTLSLSSYLPSSKIQEKLLKLKISNVYELVYYCQNTEREEDLSLCQTVIQSVSSINIEEIETKERSRFTKFFNDPDVLSYLRSQDIRTFGPLVHYLEQLENEAFTPEMEKILSVMRFPVSVLSDNKKLVLKLEGEGYNQVIDLLIPAKIVNSLKSNITENLKKVLTSLINTLTYQEVCQIITKNHYPISKLSLIEDILLKELVKAGYATVAHLKSAETIIADTSKLNLQQISRILRLFDSPIYYMSEMIKDYPQSAFILHNKGVNTLWDIFLVGSKEISKITGVSVRQITSYLSTLNPQAIKLAQKDLIALKETLTYLTVEDVKRLEQSNITSLQQLLFLTKENKTASSLQRSNVKKLIQLLGMPLNAIEIKEVVIKQLEQQSITSVKDFIIYPAEPMAGKVDLSYVMIKRIKGRLPLATKKKVKKPAKKPSSAKPTTKKKTTAAKKSVTTQRKAKTTAVSSKPKPKSTKQMTLVDMKHTSKKKPSSASKTRKNSKSTTKKGEKS